MRKFSEIWLVTIKNEFYFCQRFEKKFIVLFRNFFSRFLVL